MWMAERDYACQEEENELEMLIFGIYVSGGKDFVRGDQFWPLFDQP